MRHGKYSKTGSTQEVKLFDAGWSGQALHDAINVICTFNFMNRIVLGHGGTQGDISTHFEAAADYLTNAGYYNEDAP